MRPVEVIISHQNTDFDALGSMLAARRLYPGATVLVHGGLNRNVREFAALHEQELTRPTPPLRPVRGLRVIVVETCSWAAWETWRAGRASRGGTMLFDTTHGAARVGRARALPLLRRRRPQ
jgi:hypothetical protein